MRRTIAAAHQLRPGTQAAIDVPEHALVLRLIDQCTHLHIRVERVSDANRLRTFLQTLEEFIRQFIGNQYATGGRAHLSGVEETAATGQIDSQFEIGVVEHQ